MPPPEAEVLSFLYRYDLVVDLDTSILTTCHAARKIRGRPIVCGVLASLIFARGRPVTPEALYRQVWGGGEYHPLRHRNALYVAVNRARGALRELLGRPAAIETLPSGWRLAPDLDACVIRSIGEAQ